jgi:drug/metabolite transporter (DMT)-like permease
VRKNYLGHLITFFTVSIWGTTYVATKILLVDFDPVEILFYRFLIGYIALFTLYPRIHRIKNLKDEALFFALGLTGVSIYFLLENMALQLTLATNVGLLAGTVPILTAILSHFFTTDEKFRRNFFWGFVVAFSGTALVIFNSQVVLKLNPLGDFLALMAPLTWALYSILLKKVNSGYHPIYVTRKSFFYGLLTVLPIMLILGADWRPAGPLDIPLVVNLGFLGLIASAVCFVSWNKAVEIIGAIKASSYIYLVPLISMVTSLIILKEQVNLLAIGGGLLILTGVYISEKGGGWIKKEALGEKAAEMSRT